jgi:hypothetical protein
MRKMSVCLAPIRAVAGLRACVTLHFIVRLRFEQIQPLSHCI